MWNDKNNVLSQSSTLMVSDHDKLTPIKISPPFMST